MTILEGIELSIGRSGAIIPNARLKVSFFPTSLSLKIDQDITVSSSSDGCPLHFNPKFMFESENVAYSQLLSLYYVQWLTFKNDCFNSLWG